LESVLHFQSTMYRVNHIWSLESGCCPQHSVLRFEIPPCDCWCESSLPVSREQWPVTSHNLLTVCQLKDLRLLPVFNDCL
jgi:hypothetical protein